MRRTQADLALEAAGLHMHLERTGQLDGPEAERMLALALIVGRIAHEEGQGCYRRGEIETLPVAVRVSKCEPWDLDFNPFPIPGDYYRDISPF
jgi:hypothetical protein